MAGILETEYLTGNGLTPYPFKDAQKLTSNMGWKIPTNFLLDAQITFQVQEAFGAYLNYFANDPTTQVVKFQITAYDIDGTDLFTEIFNIAYIDLVIKEFVYYSSANSFVKLVVGQGLVDFKTLPGSVHTFLQTDADFSPGAVIQNIPFVRTIGYYNKKNIALDAEFVFQQDAGDALIEEGTNVDFSDVDGTSLIGIVPGAGKGLYDACSPITGVIKSINQVRPNTLGNFFLETDDCYISTPLIYGINIANICTPRCEPVHITGFAHYANRIKDALLITNQYVTNITTEINDVIDEYYNVILPAKNQLSFSVKYLKTALSLHSYFSVIISLFNPKDTDHAADVNITTDAIFVKEESVVINDADPSLIPFGSYSTVVKCRGSTKISFYLQVPKNEARTLTVVVPSFTALTSSTITLIA